MFHPTKGRRLICNHGRVSLHIIPSCPITLHITQVQNNTTHLPYQRCFNLHWMSGIFFNCLHLFNISLTCIHIQFIECRIIRPNKLCLINRLLTSLCFRSGHKHNKVINWSKLVFCVMQQCKIVFGHASLVHTKSTGEEALMPRKEITVLKLFAILLLWKYCSFLSWL